MRHMWVCCIAIVFVGCATSGNPSVQDDRLTQQVVAGKTTKAEVTELLGSPNLTYEAEENGKTVEIWSYAFSQIETDPALYIPVIGLLTLTSEGAITSRTKGFSVSFNEQGTVIRLARIDLGSRNGGN